MQQKQGIVCVLTNPCMPGIVKIGMTERNEMDPCLRELYTTGVSLPFECKFACKVKKTECGKMCCELLSKILYLCSLKQLVM